MKACGFIANPLTWIPDLSENQLTLEEKKPIEPSSREKKGGAGYMGGTVIWSPKAKRFYVQVYWAEKKWRFWKWNGEYLWGRPVADKLLNRIRTEIDDGTFVPESYLKDSPLSIKEYSKQWLEASAGIDNTKRFYRSCIKRVINYFGENFDIRKFTHS
jgi:hypothetical protein